jgi:hypothetical protein
MRAILRLVAAVIAGTTIATAAQAEDGRSDWRYCQLAIQPYGKTVYFSEVFVVEDGTYGRGIENAFNSFVTARHDPDAISGAICLGPYESRSDAENALNDGIGRVRRMGNRVVFTQWRYHGD